MESGHEGVVGCFAGIGVTFSVRVFEVCEGFLDRRLLVSRDLVAEFSELFLGLEDRSVGFVEFVSLLFGLLIGLLLRSAVRHDGQA